MSLKQNVEKYNEDIDNEDGYGYTQETNYSAFLANKRVTDATIEYIQLFHDQIDAIIDIGCGDGTYTNEIKIKFQDKYVAGLDPATKAIDYAKRKYPGVHFFVEDAQKYMLNSEEKKFDLAILRSILHHSADPEEVINTVSSYAEKILIIEPNGNNLVRKILEKTSSYYIEHEEISFRPKTITKWCEKSGYTINRIDFIGFVPLFFPVTLSKIIYFLTPALERIPMVRKYFSAVYVIQGTKKTGAEQRHKR